ncbi:hypothetical protein CLU79DRAFT_322404 [Phycomyces nitens]|nr:hypothetical protein CLU79DRAFT_322404 [Phycomyces nitens]
MYPRKSKLSTSITIVFLFFAHTCMASVLEYQERAVDERMGGGSLEELHWTEHVDSTANETTVDEYHHQEEETTSEWQGTLYAMDTVPSSPSLRKSPFASFISLETGDDDWSDRDMIPIPLKASSRLFGDGLPLSSNGTEDAIGGGGGGSRRNSLKRRLSVSQKSPVIPKQTYTAGYPDIQSHQQSSRLFASGQTFYGKKTPYTSAAATPVAEKAFFIQDDDIMDQNYHGDFMSRNDYTLDFSLVMEMSRETEVRREEKMDQDEDEFDWDTAGALERLRNQSTSMLFAQVADAHAHSMNTLEMRDRRAGTWDDTLSETDALVSGPVSPINDVLPDALYLSQRSVPPDLFSGHASPRTPVARNMAHNLTHEINLAKERYKAEQRASLSLVKPTMAAATLLEAELDLSKSRLYKRRSKPEFDLDLEPSISPVWHAKSHDGEDIEEHHAEDTFVAYFDEDTIKEAQKKLLDLTTDKPSNPINNQESDTGPSVVFNQSTRPVTESIASFVEPETKPFELVSDQSTTTIKAWELPYSEVWDSSMASKQSALFEERMAALKQPLKQTTTTTSTVFTSFGKPTKFVDSQDAQWKSDGSWVIEDMPGHSTVLVEEKQTVVDTTPSPRATNELHSAMEDVLQTTETIFTLDSQTQPQSLEDIPSNVSNRSIETTSAFSSQTFVKVPEQSPMELLEGDLPIIETIITRSTTSLLSKDNDVSIKQADSLKQNLESLAKHLDSSKHVSQSTRVVGETDFTTTKETIVQDEQEEDMVLNAAPAQPIEVVWRQITVENSDGEEVELEEVEVDILEQDDIHEMRNEITEILLDEEESTENSSTLVRNLYVDISEDYDSDGSQEDTGDYSVEIEEDSDSYYDDEFLVAIEQDVSELVVLDEVPIEIVEGVWEALTENSIEEEASVTVQTDARTQEAPDAPKPEQDLATITLTTERSVSSIPITIVHESEPVDDSLAESKCLSSSEESVYKTPGQGHRSTSHSFVETLDDGNPKLEQSVIGSVEKLDILETVTLVTDEVPTVIVSTPEPAKSTTVTRTIVVSDERVPCELETDKSNVRTTITKTVFVDTFGDMETQEIVLEESLPIDISTETYTTQTITLVEEEPETHTDHVAKDSTSTTCKTIHVSNLDSSPSESHIDQSALESKAEVEPKTVEPKNTKDSKDTFGETVHVTHSETKSPRTDKTDYSVSKSRSMYTKAWIVEPYQTEREHEDVSEDSLFSSRVIVSETTNEDEDEEEEEEDGQNIGRRTSIRSARAVMDLLPPMESTLSRESVMSYDSMNSVVTAMLETQYTGQDSGSDYSSTRIINVPPTEISSQPEVVVENEEDMAMQAAVDRSSRLHSRVSTSEDYESERVQTITSSSSGQSLGLPRVRQKSNSTRDGDGSEHSSYFEGSAVYLSANEYEPTDMMSVSSGVDSIDWHSATGSMDFVEVVAQDDDEDEAETDARVAQWVMEELEAPSIHRLERSTSRDHLLYRYFQRQQLGGQTGGHTESTEFESVEVDVISQDSEDEGSVGSDKTAT